MYVCMLACNVCMYVRVYTKYVYRYVLHVHIWCMYTYMMYIVYIQCISLSLSIYIHVGWRPSFFPFFVKGDRWTQQWSSSKSPKNLIIRYCFLSHTFQIHPSNIPLKHRDSIWLRSLLFLPWERNNGASSKLQRVVMLTWHAILVWRP